MTVTMIDPGRDIDLQVHEHGDQFMRVETGKARVQMGPSEHDDPVDVRSRATA
jgi:mannose-6-phosphate isomerase-like protein (cupin superfamily)